MPPVLLIPSYMLMSTGEKEEKTEVRTPTAIELTFFLFPTAVSFPVLLPP